MLRGKRVERVSSVMIVIIQGRLPTQLVTLNLGYTVAGTMYQATTVIHSLTRIDSSSTDSTSLVAHVIFVMIVIIKCFWSENRQSSPLKELVTVTNCEFTGMFLNLNSIVFSEKSEKSDCYNTVTRNCYKLMEKTVQSSKARDFH